MGRKGSSEVGDAADSSSADEPLDQAEVSRVIHENLTLLKHGDLFMEGLGQECYGQLIAAKGEESKMTDNLSKFLSIVADALVKAEGVDGSAVKKRKKRYLKVLKMKREAIETEIRQFENGRIDQMEKNGSGGPGGEASQSAEEAVHRERCAVESEPRNELENTDGEKGAGSNGGDELDEDMDESTSSFSPRRLKKKSKKKKKRRDKKKPKKEKRRRSKADLDSESDGESDSAPGKGMDEEARHARFLEAKEEFEKKKRKTLAAIPEDVKSRFRQLCFCNWSKSWLPGLELGPYDVPPGPVRDQWFTMFKNVTRQNRSLTRLVYWYGTPRDNQEFAYSFLQPKVVVPYEEAVARHLDRLPPKVQKKLDAGRLLTKSELHHQRGLEEIKGEVDLDLSDRLAWTGGWEEEYEMISSDQLLQEEVEGESLLEDGDPAEVEEQSSKKGKKRKKRKKDEEQEKTKGSKRGKKRRRTKDDSEERNEEQAVVIKKSKKGKKQGKAKGKDDQHEKEEDNAMEIEEGDLDEEIPSDAENDDDFRDEEGSGIESEEELEDDLGSKRKGKSGSSLRKKKSGSQKKKKAEMTDEDKEKARQERLARRRERDRQRRADKKKEKEEQKINGEEGKKGPHEEEQRRFEECERMFLPIMGRLEEALSAADADIAEQCLNDLHRHIETITPPFVREHSIGMSIKRTRKAFEGRGNIKPLCHGLTKELKRVYLEKENLVPKDFQPRKTSDKDKVDVGVKSPPSDADEPTVKSITVEVKEEKELAKDAQPLSPKKIEKEPSSPKKIKEEPSSPKKSKEEKVIPDQPVPKKTPSTSGPEQITQPETSRAAQARPARKGFSLKGMFERPKPTPKAKEKSVASDRAMSAAKPTIKKEAPKWLTMPAPADDSLRHDSYRSLALEFFLDAMRHLPSGRVNADAAARAFESAVFNYSQLFANMKSEGAGDRPLEVYWEKVHDISASIAGKQGPGTLFQDILDGVYGTPMDVVKLKRKSVIASLEGLPT